MHGGILRGLVCALALGALCAGPAGVWGQDGVFPPSDPGYLAGGHSQFTSVGAYRADESDDLAARVADLEAELKKITDKAAADKKKAAGKPSVTVGGRIQLDYALFDQDAVSIGSVPGGDWQDGVEFRRARLFAKGETFDVIDYKIQMDFADTDEADQDGGADPNQLIQSTAFKDVYITVNELPVLGHVRIGNFKEPFGLEQLTSANYITFMERSVCDEYAFVPGRRVGVMAFNHSASERFTWAIGAFRNELENGGEPPRRFDDDGGTALTMRCTLLPWYDEASDGRGLLHCGFGFSHRDVDDDNYRFRARPEAHIAPYVVDTHNIANVSDLQLYNAELALVYGPFFVQSEYFHTDVSRAGADPAFDGVYVYFSYFLTGEHRRYRRSAGVFDRVKPFENFFLVRTCDGDLGLGKGAWEMAYRYSYMDLNDAGVLGGLVSNHTLGLNWYLNPYTRLMWNYVNSYSTDGDPAVKPQTTQHIYEMRAQIDF